MGCDVASFGENQPPADDPDTSELVWNDPFNAVYRKLIFNKAGTRLRGGILVGDATDYDALHKLAVKNPEDLEVSPATLLAPPAAHGVVSSGDGGIPTDPGSQVCSCNDVTLASITSKIQEIGSEATLKEVKTCTQAGTGCGGCEPLVKGILKAELEKLGGSLSNNMCPCQIQGHLGGPFLTSRA